MAKKDNVKITIDVKGDKMTKKLVRKAAKACGFNRLVKASDNLVKLVKQFRRGDLKVTGVEQLEAAGLSVADHLRDALNNYNSHLSKDAKN
jgi:chemotaxis protein histidine kinase CheA